MPTPMVTPTSRQAAHCARDVLTVLPVLAHGLHGILTHRGASAPNGGDGRGGDQSDAEYCKFPGRNGEIDAPVEGLAVDDIDQNQAERSAESEAIRHAERARENTLAREHADDLPAQHADMPQHPELGTAGEGG